MDIKEGDWNRIVNLNLKSVFVPRVVRGMIRYGIKGKIVNISSYAGKCPVVGELHYSAAKAGVIALTQALAKELAKYGINVNAVCPGWTYTPGLRRRGRIHLERFPGAAGDVDELRENREGVQDPLGKDGETGGRGWHCGFPSLKRCRLYDGTGDKRYGRVGDALDACLRAEVGR